MLTFAEEILLLMLDDEDGTFLPTRTSAVEYVLAGAVLLDLAFASRIDTDERQLLLLDQTPTGNPILDRVLNRISSSGGTRDTRAWIEKITSEDTDEIRSMALDGLVKRGILEAGTRNSCGCSARAAIRSSTGAPSAKRSSGLAAFCFRTTSPIPGTSP